jgi:hypothetical protein
VVLEPQHLVRDEVDGDDDTLDRVRVAVVLLVVADVRHDAGEPAPLLPLDAEPARRPRVALHEVEVGDAARPQRVAPALVRLHDLDRARELLQQVRRVLPVQRHP